MITISKQQDHITLISVFSTQSSDQQQLLNLLTMAVQKTIKKIPGFISAALHRSIDGTKVTVYGQWESMQHYQQMHNNPQVVAYMSQVLKIAKYDPGIYEVIEEFFPG